MRIPTILLYGSSIINDDILVSGLKKYARILKHNPCSKILKKIYKGDIDLMVMEISDNNNLEFEILKEFKKNYPCIRILLINGKGNLNILAEAFHLGITDAFKKPYKRELLIERVQALLE